MLHSIGDESHRYNIPLSDFEKFIQAIKRNNIIRLEEWGNNENFMCLTFDDVPDSFYYQAYPRLKELGIPFTIFVSCSLLDTKNYITTDMLLDMAASNLCTVGSHGWHHVMYRDLTQDEFIFELKASKEKLESLIHKSVDLFAYPYGSFTACGYKYLKITKRYYKYGFGTISSPITKPSMLKDYYLPRVNINSQIINTLYKENSYER
jgi:peptidoglycan/xylan/chitin deacetylase (PgdA/CDA1 family)